MHLCNSRAEKEGGARACRQQHSSRLSKILCLTGINPSVSFHLHEQAYICVHRWGYLSTHIYIYNIHAYMHGCIYTHTQTHTVTCYMGEGRWHFILTEKPKSKTCSAASLPNLILNQLFLLMTKVLKAISHFLPV